MNPIRWRCKVCETRGIDGPKGWLAHNDRWHVEKYGGATSHASFGFTGGLDGNRMWSGDPARPVWCVGGDR